MAGGNSSASIESGVCTAALLEGMRFAPNRTARWVEETLEVRLKRQQRVTAGQLAIHQIVDE